MTEEQKIEIDEIKLLVLFDLRIRTFNENLILWREKIYSIHAFLNKQEYDLTEGLKSLKDVKDKTATLNRNTKLFKENISKDTCDIWYSSFLEFKTICKLTTKKFIDYCKEADRFKIMYYKITADYILINTEVDKFKGFDIEYLCQNKEMCNRFYCYEEILDETIKKYKNINAAGGNYLSKHAVFTQKWKNVDTEMRAIRSTIETIDLPNRRFMGE